MNMYVSDLNQDKIRYDTQHLDSNLKEIKQENNNFIDCGSNDVKLEV